MRSISLFFLSAIIIVCASCGGGNGISKAKMESGKKFYQAYCQSCHMEDGAGVPDMNAPLINSKYAAGDKGQLINIVLHGSAAFPDEKERTYSNQMPGIPSLENSEVADVLTYIRNSFNNKASEITVADVELARGNKK